VAIDTASVSGSGAEDKHAYRPWDRFLEARCAAGLIDRFHLLSQPCGLSAAKACAFHRRQDSAGSAREVIVCHEPWKMSTGIAAA